MAQDPGDRPGSAQALQTQLQALQQQLGTQAAMAAQSRRGLWVAAGLLLVVGAGTWAVWGPGGSQGEEEPGGSQGIVQPTNQSDGPSSANGERANPDAPSNTDPNALRFTTDQTSGDPLGTGAEAANLAAAFEQEAQDALQAIAEQDLDDEERILKLRELAAQFQGSRRRTKPWNPRVASKRPTGARRKPPRHGAPCCRASWSDSPASPVGMRPGKASRRPFCARWNSSRPWMPPIGQRSRQHARRSSPPTGRARRKKFAKVPPPPKRSWRKATTPERTTVGKACWISGRR